MPPAEPRLRILLLGRTAVEVDGAEREPPPRTHGLLAILASSPEGVGRLDLALMVAPDRDGQQARRRLSRLLWLLREALPELGLEATPRRVRLDLDRCEVDAAEAEAIAAGDDPSADEEALARLAGTFCPQSDIPWVRRRRARLSELATRVGIRVAETRIARSDHVAAWETADWVLERNPGSARALELRLACDLALDRRDDGLDLLARWCERRGIEESEAPGAVRDLAAALRTGQARPASMPPADATPAEWLRHARLVGERGDEPARRAALERLRAAVADGRLPRSVTRLAEVDAALDRHELALAERLLAMAETDSDPLDLRVRRSRLALAQGALDEAADEASRALVGAYVDQREDARLEALLLYASAQSERARGREALSAASQARETARRMNRLDAELSADVITGKEEIRQGWYGPAADRMLRVRERAMAARLALIEGQALRELSRARCRMGEFESAAILQEEELALWQRLGYPVREAAACNEHSYTLICMGKHDEALRVTERALRLAETNRAALAAAWARGFTALATVCRDGATPAAFEVAREAAAAADASRNPELIAVVSLVRGFLSHMCGDPSTSLAHLARAREQYTNRGEFAHMPVVLALEALVRLQLGEVEAALATTSHGLTEVAQLGAGDFGFALHYAHARALEAAGRTEEARRWTERGMERVREIAASAGVSAEELTARDPLTRALAAEGIDQAPVPPVADGR